ncbi:MAG: galactokinase, partial [Microbacteriaceae bacterium]|nr:galactokinase [Microbacteriaceae bacterium]
MTVEQGALDLFRERFGRTPDGVWQAPGRVNLIGEHTDYNEGYVLPFAIDRSTAAALAVRDDGRIRVASTFDEDVVDTTLEEVAGRRFDGWSAYPLGVAWAFGEAGTDLGASRGFDLALDSDVPVGAGLSSSAAIEMAAAF